MKCCSPVHVCTSMVLEKVTKDVLRKKTEICNDTVLFSFGRVWSRQFNVQCSEPDRRWSGCCTWEVPGMSAILYSGYHTY